MKQLKSFQHLLLVGAGPRLVVAGAIVAVLWLGYLWATSTPGAL